MDIKRVLVVGDTILDHYVYGDVSRVNPEAPHSVVLDHQKEEMKLGGACNVAMNIAALTEPSTQVHYYGALSETIEKMFRGVRVTGEYTHKDSEILTKTRFISNNHHILRMDRGQKYQFQESFKNLLEEKLSQYQYDLIVVSDYNKGTITRELFKTLLYTNRPVLLDLKKRKNMAYITFSSRGRAPNPNCPYSSNLIVKCNAKEFDEEVDAELIDHVEGVVKTQGALGCQIHDRNYNVVNLPAVSNGGTVADVVGAGDSFLAGMATEYLRTGLWNAVTMAEYGNACASEKVRHFGTYVVTDNDMESK